MELLRKVCLAASVPALLICIVGLVLRNAVLWQSAAVLASVALAIGLGAVPALRGYQFTAWIVASVVTALIFPSYFLSIGPLDTSLFHLPQISFRDKRIILTIMQLVMFGMGTQMSIADLAGLGRMSYGVIVGVLLQFTVMPVVGYLLAIAFGFPPEIAAGIVLIGSCSSGLASNVMSYLAKANLTLSVSLTAVGTLTAPLTTPLWMKLLAGRMVSIDFVGMMIDIIKLVIVPIGAALLHDYLKHASRRGRCIVWSLAALGIAWFGWLVFGGSEYAAPALGARGPALFDLVGFLFGAVIAGVVFHEMVRVWPGLPNIMPLFSMFGIIFFTAVTTAAGREDLLKMGWLLLLVSILHNAAGLVLGYSISRACGLDVTTARTVALEVGIQNGGMASGLAGGMGMLATVGLAPAVFSPWQNFSGSILANYWRRRPVEADVASKSATD